MEYQIKLPKIPKEYYILCKKRNLNLFNLTRYIVSVFCGGDYTLRSNRWLYGMLLDHAQYPPSNYLEVNRDKDLLVEANFVQEALQNTYFLEPEEILQEIITTIWKYNLRIPKWKLKNKRKLVAINFGIRKFIIKEIYYNLYFKELIKIIKNHLFFNKDAYLHYCQNVSTDYYGSIEAYTLRSLAGNSIIDTLPLTTFEKYIFYLRDILQQTRQELCKHLDMHSRQVNRICSELEDKLLKIRNEIEEL